MDRNDFLNRLKVLHSIDKWDLEEVGFARMRDDRNWVAFREKPAAWLLNADDGDAAIVWALVESRCKSSSSLAGKLEPVTEAIHKDTAAYSAAVSLKRIADALTGNDPGVCDTFHDLGLNFRKGWERAG